MSPADPAPSPATEHDDELDEYTDGPPVAGVALLAAAVCVVVWVGIALAALTVIERYAPLLWGVR